MSDDFGNKSPDEQNNEGSVTKEQLYANFWQRYNLDSRNPHAETSVVQLESEFIGMINSSKADQMLENTMSSPGVTDKDQIPLLSKACFQYSKKAIINPEFYTGFKTWDLFTFMLGQVTVDLFKMLEDRSEGKTYRGNLLAERLAMVIKQKQLDKEDLEKMLYKLAYLFAMSIILESRWNGDPNFSDMRELADRKFTAEEHDRFSHEFTKMLTNIWKNLGYPVSELENGVKENFQEYSSEYSNNLQTKLSLLMLSVHSFSYAQHGNAYTIPYDGKESEEDAKDEFARTSWLNLVIFKNSLEKLEALSKKDNPDQATELLCKKHLTFCAESISNTQVAFILADLLPYLLGTRYEGFVIGKILPQLKKKIFQSPEWIPAYCHYLAWQKRYPDQFSRIRNCLLLKNDAPPDKKFIDGLLDQIRNPQPSTFYSACGVLAFQAVTFPQSSLASYYGKVLWPRSSDLTDPVRSAALRYMLEAIPQLEQRKIFFQQVISENDGQISLSKQAQEMFIKRMNEFSLYLQDNSPGLASPEQTAKPSGFLDGSPETKARDLDALRDYILRNRSINISQQGNRLGKTGVDSSLEEIITETKITNNKESRKFPKTLACHISLKSQSGRTLYLRMTKDNTLLLRLLEEGQSAGELPFSEVESLYGIGKDTQQEIHYFVLCKLRDVFVRRKSDPPKSVSGTKVETEEQASTSDEPTPTLPEPIAEPEPETPAVPETPLTEPRVELPHIIDITDNSPRVTREEMEVKDLESKKEEEKVFEAVINREIENNSKKIRKILGLIKTGKTLPELLPEDWSDLIIYKKIVINREEYYEAVPFNQFYQQLRTGQVNLEEYYIRTVRAFTQSLPYIKTLTPQKELKMTVKRKQRQTGKVNMKMELFRQSGESYGLSMAPIERPLIFESEDTPANRAIFEKLSKRTDEEIRKEVAESVQKALLKNLEEARKKIVRPNLQGEKYQQAKKHYQKVADRMIRLAKYRETQKALQEIELRSKLAEKKVMRPDLESPEGIQKYIKLQMPQMFPFEQTFNQGQFESLADLMEKA